MSQRHKAFSLALGTPLHLSSSEKYSQQLWELWKKPSFCKWGQRSVKYSRRQHYPHKLIPFLYGGTRGVFLTRQITKFFTIHCENMFCQFIYSIFSCKYLLIIEKTECKGIIVHMETDTTLYWCLNTNKQKKSIPFLFFPFIQNYINDNYQTVL